MRLRRFITSAALLLFCFFSLPAQPREQNIIASAFFSRTGTASWGSGGPTASALGIRTAPLINPALLHPDRNSVYLEFGKRYRSKYRADLNIDGQYSLPNFGSLSLRFAPLAFSVGYSELYHRALSSGEIPITTVEHPEGTGEFFELKENRTVHTFFASAAYHAGEWLSVGVTAGYNVALLRDEFWQTTMEGDGGGVMVVGGLLLRPVPFLNAGSSVTWSEKISLHPSFSGKGLSAYDPENDTVIVQAAPVIPSIVADMPLTITTGATLIFSQLVSLNFGHRYTEWSGVAGYQGYNDTEEYSVGLRFNAADELSVRCGWFSSSEPTTMNLYQSSYFIPLHQDFWTIGFTWTFLPKTEFSLSVLQAYTSRLEGFHQGNILAGLGYDW